MLVLQWVGYWWDCFSVTQSCLTVCNPMNCSPPDSSVHGILQARIMEWVAISFCKGFSTQRLKLHPLHWQEDSLTLSHQRSPTDEKEEEKIYNHIEWKRGKKHGIRERKAGCKELCLREKSTVGTQDSWAECQLQIRAVKQRKAHVWTIWSEKVAQLCPTLCDPIDYIVREILQARILEWVAFPFSRGSSQPRDRTQVFRIAGRFFTSWAIGKPKNTRLGSLSLFQQIFPTQESNLGPLHCRWILYQLCYQGSPWTIWI